MATECDREREKRGAPGQVRSPPIRSLAPDPSLPASGKRDQSAEKRDDRAEKRDQTAEKRDQRTQKIDQRAETRIKIGERESKSYPVFEFHFEYHGEDAGAALPRGRRRRYRGTSLIRNIAPLGLYIRSMPRAL